MGVFLLFSQFEYVDVVYFSEWKMHYRYFSMTGHCNTVLTIKDGMISLNGFSQDTEQVLGTNDEQNWRPCDIFVSLNNDKK